MSQTNGSRIIKLSGKRGKGKFAIVDADDYEELIKHRWHLQGGGYVARYNKTKPLLVLMHRQVMSTPKNMQTDHINHNKLDNRKDNLRVCTSYVNQQNRTRQGFIEHHQYVRKNGKTSNYYTVRFQKNGILYSSKPFREYKLAYEKKECMYKELYG